MKGEAEAYAIEARAKAEAEQMAKKVGAIFTLLLHTENLRERRRMSLMHCHRK